MTDSCDYVPPAEHLALSAAVLSSSTLLDERPTILAVRFAAVDPELECDVVVAASALVPDDDPLRMGLPEEGASAPWAGVSPPQRGWEAAGSIGSAVLARRAQWGIASVAEALPSAPGEEIVHTVRGRVWGAEDAELAGLPTGVAFAAHAFGFIGGEEEAALFRSGPWMRASLRRGHVLTRTTVRSGLTAVRTTGR